MSMTSGSNRFEVRLNGAVVATAGVEQYGVLTGILTWVLHDPDAMPEHGGGGADPEIDRGEWLAEELSLNVGGLDSPSGDHLYWFERALKVGDEVTMRILPPGPIDEPARKHYVIEDGVPRTDDGGGGA